MNYNLYRTTKHLILTHCHSGIPSHHPHYFSSYVYHYQHQYQCQLLWSNTHHHPLHSIRYINSINTHIHIHSNKMSTSSTKKDSSAGTGMKSAVKGNTSVSASASASDAGKAALDYNDEADNTLPITTTKKNKSNKSTTVKSSSSSSSSSNTKSFASNTRELYATASDSIPAGQLKSFDGTMADAYQPQLVESNWDKWWEMNDLYKPVENSTAEPFVIVIPPPNVTGVLHIGHGLTGSIEDAIVRYMRMNGRNTLWIPGSDHAGIATQVVVEKRIARDSNGTVTRHTLGREKFEAEVFKWKENNGNIIYQQYRRLGVSTDWSREAFTMNELLSNAVKQAFIRLHKKGIIYRANRIVNWSCTLRTAISNLEVEYIELDGSTMLHVPSYDQQIEFGVLHSFAYKVLDDKNQATDEEIIVATTRIETMLGDVAVAVHPADERYKHLHNRHLQHPFVPSRKVRIVTDDVLVDMAFGTGAVKVTPAHDPNDFACGKRHELDEINIFTDDGLINANGGTLFQGMKRFDARDAVINELKKLNLYRGKSNNKMSIGICSRSKDIVEPIVRPQWWMNCKDAAKRAIDAVKNGQLKLIPNSHDKIWFHWLENIQEWCISRQLWWGHRIP
jgi:valyl-tRNA synthetase